MGKLSGIQIEEYFNKHLPYRNRVLLAHKNICSKGCYNGEPAILQACFEASLVTGRMYLNVLGIKMGKNGLMKMDFRKDDISAQDLGGELVDVPKIPLKDGDLFMGFLKMADKNVHLTQPMNHPWNKTRKAIDLIVTYLKKYLYVPTKHDFSF